MKRKKLKMLRQEHELTQQQMADITGRSRNAYIKIERGERNPTPDFWERLQKAFNIPDEEMYSYQKGGN